MLSMVASIQSITCTVSEMKYNLKTKEVEYQLECTTVCCLKDDDELVLKWNLWKTFYDFRTFHECMLHSEFRTACKALSFPGSHKTRSFFGKTKSEAFLNKRMEELNQYMNEVCQVDQVLMISENAQHENILLSFVAAHEHVTFCTKDEKIIINEEEKEIIDEDTSSDVLEEDHTIEVDNNEHEYDELQDAKHLESSLDPQEQLFDRILQLSDGDEKVFKGFKKMAKRYGKCENASVGADEFWCYLTETFGREEVTSFLPLLLLLLSNPSRRAALERVSTHDFDFDTDSDEASIIISPEEKLMRLVGEALHQDEEEILRFKSKSRKLGSSKITAAEFAHYVRSTFNGTHVDEIIRLVSSVIPSSPKRMELEGILQLWSLENKRQHSLRKPRRNRKTTKSQSVKSLRIDTISRTRRGQQSESSLQANSASKSRTLSSSSSSSRRSSGSSSQNNPSLRDRGTSHANVVAPAPIAAVPSTPSVTKATPPAFTENAKPQEEHKTGNRVLDRLRNQGAVDIFRFH